MKQVGIVDFGMSNLFSVQTAFKKLGIATFTSSSFKDLATADALVLPGVGAFELAAAQLTKLKLTNFLQDWISNNNSFLGICLGMQLLFEKSEEFGQHSGLGIFEGSVKSFKTTFESKGLSGRIPCVGWNNITKKSQSWLGSAFDCLNPDKSDVYFVHSYFCEPKNNEIILAEAEYSNFVYCAAIRQKNLTALQFHPEKSGEVGLTMLQNWIKQENF